VTKSCDLAKVFPVYASQGLKKGAAPV